MNRATLIGHVGKDPDVRQTEKSKVASFSFATTERYKSGDEKKEVTEWHNIVCWSKLADIVEGYVKKGDKLLIEGRIAHRSYDDKDGNKRYITEIVCNNLIMLGGKPEPKKEEDFNPLHKPEEEDGLPF